MKYGAPLHRGYSRGRWVVVGGGGGDRVLLAVGRGALGPRKIVKNANPCRPAQNSWRPGLYAQSRARQIDEPARPYTSPPITVSPTTTSNRQNRPPTGPPLAIRTIWFHGPNHMAARPRANSRAVAPSPLIFTDLATLLRCEVYIAPIRSPRKRDW